MIHDMKKPLPMNTMDGLISIISTAGNTITDAHITIGNTNNFLVYSFEIQDSNGITKTIVFIPKHRYLLKSLELKLDIHQLDSINKLLSISN